MALHSYWGGVPLEQRAKIAKALKDPVQFPKQFLKSDVWDVQADILRAVSKPHSRVAVKACHASGKTFTAANAALTFLARWKEAIVITTAPTQNQVEAILWPEIHNAIIRGSYPFPKPLLTELKLGPKRYAIGFTTSVTKGDEGVKFQGFHAEHILVIMDEAPGVDPRIWGAIEGARAGGDVRILALGNPTIPGGKFYDSFHKDRSTWASFTISAFDTPNLLGCSLTYKDPNDEDKLKTVGSGKDLLQMTEEELHENQRPYLTTRHWVREKFEEWGPGHPLWEARVLGEFPGQNEFALIPLAWVEQCKKLSGLDEEADFEAGIDVAGPGEDETTLWIRRGRRLIKFKTFAESDPRGVVAAELLPYKDKIKKLKVDCIGIGYNFALHFKDLGYRVVMVNVQNVSKESDRFYDLKAELYWGLRQRFEKGEIIGLDDERTVAQLTTIMYSHDSKGRIRIESKEDMRKRGVKSPDRAEGCMLAFAEISIPYAGVYDWYAEGVKVA